VCGQNLSGVHSVSRLPLARGLDQYLADRLTNQRVFQVVTDSELADAVFTDRLGLAFENKLADLLGKPARPAAPQESETKTSWSRLRPGQPTGRTSWLTQRPTPTSDAAKGSCSWSILNPGTLHRIASPTVSRLKRDLGEK
jgi:hypothetical protein